MNSLQRSLAASLAILLCLYPAPARSLPAVGKVISGNAAITQPNTTTLNINQKTNKAIINWKGFNIDLNELVKINQPNSSAVILNRVVGADASSILGQLVANGRVFIVNSNGIYFGPRSMVEASSLFATTLGIKDSDFLAGRYKFTQDPTKSPSYVINRGQIKISDDGFVFLVAPGIANENLILANLGKVVMASGEKFTVDFMGDGLINFMVEGKVLDKVIGPDGHPLSSAVSNSGTIKADGGQVILSAKASGEIFSSVVNNSGIIEAKSLVNRGGVIRLEGSDPVENTGQVGWQANLGKVQNADGAVINTGTLDVSAAERGAAPGHVTLTGQFVGMAGNILATGADNARGGNVLLNSTDATVVTNSGLIDTSGLGHSSAGNVVIWSDNNTLFGGTILARGGNFGGNGGDVEVSGHQNLAFDGIVNLQALSGTTGTLLLDPQILNIVDNCGGPCSLDSLVSSSGQINFGASIGANTVSVSQINATGAFSNITLNAGQINFNNTADIVMGVHNLSFNTNSATAGGGNGNISNVGGNPFRITVGDIGSLNFNLAGPGPTGDINLTNITLDNSSQIYISSFGNVTLGSIKADRLTSAGNRGELIVIAGGSIANAAGANISVGGDGTYLQGGSITLGNHPGDLMSFERLWFQSPGAVSIGSITSNTSLSTSSASAAVGNNLITDLTNSAGTLILNSTGAIQQTANGSNGQVRNLIVGGNASFAASSLDLGAANNFGSLTFTSNGPVNINQATPIVLSGNNTANSLQLTSSGSISNAPNASLAVTNNAAFNGASINLGLQSGDTMNFGSLTYNSAGAVTIAEDSATNVTGTNTANTLSLTSPTAVTDSPGTIQQVTGSASFSAGTIPGGSIILADNPADVLNVGGTASFSGSPINVGSAGTANFGRLNFNGFGSADIRENSDTILTGSNRAGFGANISLTSAGSITSDPNTTLFVVGIHLIAFAVIGGNASFSGASIALADHPGDSLTVEGNASFTARNGGITIGGPARVELGGLTYNSPGAVSITTNSVMNILGSTIRGSNTANTLSLTSSGGIFDASTSQTIAGDATFNAGTSSILLAGFGSTLTVGGTASLTGSNILVGSSGSANFGAIEFNSTGPVNIKENSSTFIVGSNTAKSLALASPVSIDAAPLSSIELTDLTVTLSSPVIGRTFVQALPPSAVIINNGNVTNANFTEALSPLVADKFVFIIPANLVLTPPDVVQIDEELQKGLEISEGFDDMRLALAAVILDPYHHTPQPEIMDAQIHLVWPDPAQFRLRADSPLSFLETSGADYTLSAILGASEL